MFNFKIFKREALSVMFDLCDLDSSERLSKDELNFYTILTSNETLMDDDWKFVGGLYGKKHNCISHPKNITRLLNF
jgi:hypothetical protein